LFIIPHRLALWPPSVDASRGPPPDDVGGAGFATRQRIIEAAEVLFADRGVEVVSLRELTGLAKVNVAAIHYHFGTKEALLEHVFALRALPIAQRRFMLLDACRRDRSGSVVLRDLLEAFLRPALEIGDNPHLLSFMRLRARINIEKHATANAMLKRAFDETSKRFVAELCKTLPHLPRKDVFWRFHFILGAMTYTMANPGRIQSLSNNLCDPSDVEEALRRLISFAVTAFVAPADKPQVARTPIRQTRKRR
jgi:AcrR family transcriptional regulator